MGSYMHDKPYQDELSFKADSIDMSVKRLTQGTAGEKEL
jgi:hypothetical protein